MNSQAKPSPNDVSDAEWEFVVHDLTPMQPAPPQRVYSLRGLFNAMQYVVCTAFGWRFQPHNLSPWVAVDRQTWHWQMASGFETVARRLKDRLEAPSAMMIAIDTLENLLAKVVSAANGGAVELAYSPSGFHGLGSGLCPAGRIDRTGDCLAHRSKAWLRAAVYNAGRLELRRRNRHHAPTSQECVAGSA